MKRILITLVAISLAMLNTFGQNSNHLCFTAVNGPATIRLDSVGSPGPISLQYSTNGCVTWNAYSLNQTISLSNSGKVYFKATSTNATFSTGNWNSYRFYMTGTISASGNIMSLLDANLAQTSVPSYAFIHLFRGCTSLISAPQFPATTVGVYSYARMFASCNIDTMPDLPATNLSNGCYAMMFESCANMKVLKALPAINLAPSCYREMFVHCRSITQAPELPALVLSTGCYDKMFLNCSKLSEAPALPATRISSLCYYRMFMGCTSLKTAPELSADTLAAGCYTQMFMNCTNLRTIPTLLSNTLADSCYKEMFKGCYMISLNTTGVGTPWKIPNAASSSASTSLAWGDDMFAGTIGTLQGAPVVGLNYYQTIYYKMYVTSNNSTMGTVAGHGVYAYGSNVSISASPSEHHHFVNWSNGSTSSTTNINIVSDTVLTAIFAIDQHTITANSNNPTMGSVTGGGTYDYGQTVKLTAIANDHYHFVLWSNGLLTDTINVTMLGDTTLTATFAIDQHIVTANCNDTAMGSINGSGSYNYGQSATLTAIANDHYHFVSWSNGSTTPTITFVVQGDTSLTATFEANVYNVTVTPNYGNRGQVTGGGQYSYLTKATLSATPNDGYKFSGWDNGLTNPIINITVTSDTLISAIFEPEATPQTFDVTVLTNYANRGTVTGAGVYDSLDVATLTATPNEGYKFMGWDNGLTNRVINITVTSDTTITALFEPESTPVDNVEGKNYIVYSNENIIHINGAAGEQIRIYDLNGKLISEVDEASDEQIVSVYVAGVYFVRINEKKSIKVVVK